MTTGEARAELARARRAPWPLRVDDLEPLEAWPELGPVGRRLVAAASYATGAAVVAGGLALAGVARSRRALRRA